MKMQESKKRDDNFLRVLSLVAATGVLAGGLYGRSVGKAESEQHTQQILNLKQVEKQAK